MELSQSISTEPLSQTALILEGGGQRGIFTAGVLDAWLEQGFNPFSLLVGISAGAQNLTTYLAGQHGLARRIITDLTLNRRFFKVSRSLIKQDVIDLDWYFEQSQSEDYRIDIEAAAETP